MAELSGRSVNFSESVKIILNFFLCRFFPRYQICRSPSHRGAPIRFSAFTNHTLILERREGCQKVKLWKAKGLQPMAADLSLERMERSLRQIWSPRKKGPRFRKRLSRSFVILRKSDSARDVNVLRRNIIYRPYIHIPGLY